MHACALVQIVHVLFHPTSELTRAYVHPFVLQELRDHIVEGTTLPSRPTHQHLASLQCCNVPNAEGSSSAWIIVNGETTVVRATNVIHDDPHLAMFKRTMCIHRSLTWQHRLESEVAAPRYASRDLCDCSIGFDNMRGESATVTMDLFDRNCHFNHHRVTLTSVY